MSLLERLQDHHWRLHSADVKICLRPDGSDDVLSQGSSGKVLQSVMNMFTTYIAALPLELASMLALPQMHV